jgi:hypothetical protein
MCLHITNNLRSGEKAHSRHRLSLHSRFAESPARLDPKDGRVVFSILPHIVEHQLRLAQSTKALDCEDAGVGRVMSPVV